MNDVRGSKGMMQRVKGTDLARSVKKKYNQMISFTSFFALQQSGIGKIEALEGNRKGSYSLRVSANYRLIIKPKVKERSAENLKECDTIIIEGVIDYHGKGTKYNWLIP